MGEQLPATRKETDTRHDDTRDHTKDKQMGQKCNRAELVGGSWRVVGMSAMVRATSKHSQLNCNSKCAAKLMTQLGIVTCELSC